MERKSRLEPVWSRLEFFLFSIKFFVLFWFLDVYCSCAPLCLSPERESDSGRLSRAWECGD